MHIHHGIAEHELALFGHRVPGHDGIWPLRHLGIEVRQPTIFGKTNRSFDTPVQCFIVDELPGRARPFAVIQLVDVVGSRAMRETYLALVVGDEIGATHGRARHGLTAAGGDIEPIGTGERVIVERPDRDQHVAVVRRQVISEERRHGLHFFLLDAGTRAVSLHAVADQQFAAPAVGVHGIQFTGHSRLVQRTMLFGQADQHALSTDPVEMVGVIVPGWHKRAHHLPPISAQNRQGGAIFHRHCRRVVVAVRRNLDIGKGIPAQVTLQIHRAGLARHGQHHQQPPPLNTPHPFPLLRWTSCPERQF
ncbi:hypothetical protein D3C71_1079920 [compost metagenome]